MLTDWLQLNLIAVIKNNFPVTAEAYYEEFISSANPSVVLFGKRLKAFYEKTGEPFTHPLNLTPISEATKEYFKNPIFTSISKGKFFLKDDLFVYFLFTFKRVSPKDYQNSGYPACPLQMKKFFKTISNNRFGWRSNTIKLGNN